MLIHHRQTKGLHHLRPHPQKLVELEIPLYRKYYLGTVSKYRPQYYEEISKGRFGGHILEIKSNLPQPLIYGMARNFSERSTVPSPII